MRHARVLSGLDLFGKWAILAIIAQCGCIFSMIQETKPRILTPALCRGARGLLNWTQSDLAAHAEVSRSTVKDFETGLHEVHRATESQLLHAFRIAGLQFHQIAGAGIGIVLPDCGA
jgi:DNA-binding XRE family transcriptional regulator